MCNIMTQPSETDGYTVFEHISALVEHSVEGIIDCCIVNNSVIPPYLMGKYRNDGADRVEIDRKKIAGAGIKLYEGDFSVIKNGYVRHNPKKLAARVMDLACGSVNTKERRRIID